MEKIILVINIGSSSKKYSLYRGENIICTAHFERDKDAFEVTYDGRNAETISSEIFSESLIYFFGELVKRGIVEEGGTFDGIGVRVVSPGFFFTEDHLVDATFSQKLAAASLEDLAHIAPLQKELARAEVLFGVGKIIAISDSAFHVTIPDIAKKYTLPEDLSKETETQRFGYHGISLSSIVKKLKARPLGLEKKVIVCHLGSGASITALLDGESRETSMGYSPLDGLAMSSRIGNIDVGAVLHLVTKKGVQELQEIMYKECGLLALSGLSDDMRVLIDADKEGHSGAHKAIEAFVYSIQKYIGMYIAVLGGVDLIVFSGTIGERSYVLRERICQALSWCNVHVDQEKNIHAQSGDYIGGEGSLQVAVVHTNEDFEIMQRVESFLKGDEKE